MGYPTSGLSPEDVEEYAADMLSQLADMLAGIDQRRDLAESLRRCGRELAGSSTEAARIRESGA